MNVNEYEQAPNFDTRVRLPEPDYLLFKIIADNTRKIITLQEKITWSTEYSEIVQISEAIANLVDAQSKLVAIAQQQNPHTKRVFDYAEFLKNQPATDNNEDVAEVKPPMGAIDLNSVLLNRTKRLAEE